MEKNRFNQQNPGQGQSHPEKHTKSRQETSWNQNTKQKEEKNKQR